MSKKSIRETTTGFLSGPGLNFAAWAVAVAGCVGAGGIVYLIAGIIERLV